MNCLPKESKKPNQKLEATKYICIAQDTEYNGQWAINLQAAK